MTGETSGSLPISSFYDLGPAEPEEGTYPEEEEFEWYRNSKLGPEYFEKDPEFAKRYAAWLKAHPLPVEG